MTNISVIIPTHNRADLIARSLDSVLAQTFMPDEVIVVDDGSSDNTCELVADRYPEVRLLDQGNKGVSAARNAGIDAATGDWLCLLDSDDSWQPEKLEKQVEALNTQPEYLVCHTNEKWIRNGYHLNQLKKHKKHGGYIFQYCLPLCVISPSSIMIHRNIFNNVGMFDESMPVCEDYDLWLRICARYPVLYLDDMLITKFGGHDDQLSQQYWGMDRFRIYALEKILDENFLQAEDRAAAINMIVDKINIYLVGAVKHGNTDNIKHYNSLLEKFSFETNQSTDVGQV